MTIITASAAQPSVPRDIMKFWRVVSLVIRTLTAALRVVVEAVRAVVRGGTLLATFMLWGHCWSLGRGGWP